jgi:hypothetical protein
VLSANRIDEGGRKEGKVLSSVLLRSKTFWEVKLLRGAGEGGKGNHLYEQRARREKERK